MSEPSARRWRALAGSCALGVTTAVLLLMVYPKFDLHFLAPIALTPLLVAMARLPNGWSRFFIGWISGTTFWFFLCTWIQFVLEDHASMGKFGSWGSFTLFAVLKGLHMAVFAWMAGPLMNRVYAVPAVAALWTGLERTHATFGFTWAAVGKCGHQYVGAAAAWLHWLECMACHSCSPCYRPGSLACC